MGLSNGLTWPIPFKATSSTRLWRVLLTGEGNLMIQNSPFARSLLQRRGNPKIFPSVVLANASVPSDAAANEVFVVGGRKICSLLADAIEAADKGIVREV